MDMRDAGSTSFDRRRFLCLGAGSVLALGCSDDDVPTRRSRCSDPFVVGQRLGTVPFVGEGMAPLETPLGSGLDGRLYTDLSTLGPETLVTDTARFYVRTSYPDLLHPTTPWTIAVSGLVDRPREVTLDEIAQGARSLGTHLMECSGNGAFAHFGMLSAAAWTGVPMTEVLDLVGPSSPSAPVLVSGFDEHSQPSEKSTPGASWIFTRDELEQFGAFLATGMNGAPLTKDHGAPVRLVVPRWYGCTCIKWVNEIVFVDDSVPATSQMKEFASRTHQDGVPGLARDYRPASMDQAAMPVRVERWRTAGGGLLHRIVGVMWGGYAFTDALEIRANPDLPWMPVEVCPPQATNETWTLWSHAWSPAAPGAYAIQLRIADPTIPTRRLDQGFYVRTVEV